MQHQASVIAFASSVNSNQLAAADNYLKNNWKTFVVDLLRPPMASASSDAETHKRIRRRRTRNKDDHEIKSSTASTNAAITSGATASSECLNLTVIDPSTISSVAAKGETTHNKD
jgi:hypothetical protein